MNDLALARRVLAGDESAFDEFFSSYFPRLYRFALGRVSGNEDAAEEIAQRVLIRALNRLSTYKGEAALLTWLCTLCRREISAWLEREGRFREVSLFDDRVDLQAILDAIAAPGADDPEAAQQRRELSALVQQTLDYLPGRYGDALEWRYIQELPVGEIASRLGLSYKAAESMLTRARVSFREGFLSLIGEWSAEDVGGRARSVEGT